MSAFVVSGKTLNNVVSGIVNNPACFANVLAVIGSNDPQTISDALNAMNVDAVNQRYGESAEAESVPFIDTKPSHITVYKSCRCLRYQCSEGNVPKTALYRALDEGIQTLGYEIINALPEYAAVAWDE